MERLKREAKNKLFEDMPHRSVVFQEQGPAHNVVDAHVKRAVELHRVAERLPDAFAREQGVWVCLKRRFTG